MIVQPVVEPMDRFAALVVTDIYSVAKNVDAVVIQPNKVVNNC